MAASSGESEMGLWSAQILQDVCGRGVVSISMADASITERYG
jgi:hypothetical protein